jgi:tRNA 2-thiouridine synthesizing protein B
MSTNRTMLHTVNKSPFERNTLDSCLRLAKKGSVILFIEDGVYAALSNTEMAGKISARMDDLNFYVLGPDVDVRGLSETPIIEGINIVDYSGFVQLAADHSTVQSWL